MDKPKATMTVEQGECEIYGGSQIQFCQRVLVTVQPLIAGTTDNDGKPLREIEKRYSQRGLARLLAGIDKATSPPTPRTRKAPDDNTVVTTHGEAAGNA